MISHVVLHLLLKFKLVWPYLPSCTSSAATHLLHLYLLEIRLLMFVYEAYVRRMDVINRGYRSVQAFLPLRLQSLIVHSGYNTDEALNSMDHAVPAPTQATVRFLVYLLPPSLGTTLNLYRQFGSAPTTAAKIPPGINTFQFHASNPISYPSSIILWSKHKLPILSCSPTRRSRKQ